jgi:beta-glucuronidase
MDRLFKRSNTIKWFKLDKFWDFCLDENDVGKDLKWYESFPEKVDKMYVPACWNNTLGLYQYEGTVWYKTCFEIASDNIYLKFEGVANECDVYVDKKFIGHHYGGFVEFGWEILGLGKGEHEIVVRVNNTVDFTSTIPHAISDWYNYGGINKSVEIREFNDSYIKNSRIGYTIDGTTANLTIKANVKTLKKVTDTFEVLVDGESVYSKEVTVDGEAELVSEDIILKDVKLWDVKEGNLYYVTVKFGDEDLIDRTGFRTLAVKGKDILLNGKKVMITGVNRHEIHPDWGLSMPFELTKKDIDIIIELNCNSIRGSHYPNSKKTLDYMDEKGILFWEEVPIWGNLSQWAESFKNEDFINRAITMHTEMVNRDLNHPAIVFWGLHNEVDTTLPQTRELTIKLIETIKKLDTTRLITFASLVGEEDICLDLVDVASFNRYVGWYISKKIDSLPAYVERITSKIKEIGEKPILMSEFGAASIKGHTGLEVMRWTEEYQAEYLKKHIETFFENDAFSGTYVWQYCDMNTQHEDYLMKPRGFNNKGLLSEYRHPKLAFYTVKELYKKYNPKPEETERKFLMY